MKISINLYHCNTHTILNEDILRNDGMNIKNYHFEFHTKAATAFKMLLYYSFGIVISICQVLDLWFTKCIIYAACGKGLNVL